MSRAAIRAERYHDISCGHRVHGHESKCAFLHGHNYRIYFECQVLNSATPIEAEVGQAARHHLGVDAVGRVIDFSVMKDKLCMWVENNWDHRFIAWDQDPFIQSIYGAARTLSVEASVVGIAELVSVPDPAFGMLRDSLVLVPFNPTAENMARYLLEVIGPQQLKGTGVGLIRVTIEETRKCSASAANYL